MEPRFVSLDQASHVVVDGTEHDGSEPNVHQESRTVLEAFLTILSELKASRPNVHVSWASTTSANGYLSEHFPNLCLRKDNIVSSLSRFDISFAGRGVKRTVCVGGQYDGLSAGLLRSLLIMIAKNRQGPDSAVREAIASESRTSTVAKRTTSSTATQTSHPTAEASTQCNLPCLHCEDNVKRNRTKQQRVRRLTKEIDALKYASCITLLQSYMFILHSLFSIYYHSFLLQRQLCWGFGCGDFGDLKSISHRVWVVFRSHQYCQ